jgi:hypothetical protein
MVVTRYSQEGCFASPRPGDRVDAPRHPINRLVTRVARSALSPSRVGKIAHGHIYWDQPSARCRSGCSIGQTACGLHQCGAQVSKLPSSHLLSRGRQR